MISMCVTDALTLKKPRETARRLVKFCFYVGISIWIANDCQRTSIDLAIRYLDTSGNWVSHAMQAPDKILRAFGSWFAEQVGPQESAEEILELAEAAGFALSGNATHRHLNAMLCGLDSKVLGDEQIVGQFRDALQESREQGACEQWLGMLADEALKLSRRIRKQVDYSRLPTSVSEVAADILKKRLHGEGGRIVLVGSGEMTGDLASRMAGWYKVALHFVNRTVASAERLGREHGGTWQSLAEFQKNPLDFDHLVSATSAPDPVLGVAMMKRLPKQDQERLILDLGVPADSETAIALLPGFERLDVLEVGAQAEANEEVARSLRRRVRPMLREGGLHFREKIFRRHLSPIASRLRSSVEERARNEAARWAKSRLAHLDDADLALFQEFALRLADQTVQVPLVALRKTLREMPMGEMILQRLRSEGRRAAEQTGVESDVLRAEADFKES